MFKYYLRTFDHRWLMNALAYSGNIRAVQWAHTNGCERFEWTSSSVAHNGNWDMVKWLHSQGCPWNRNTCYATAEQGNVEMLQWLHSEGCPSLERRHMSICSQQRKRGNTTVGH